MSLTTDIPLVMKSTNCMVHYIHALYGAPCPLVYCATFCLHFTHLQLETATHVARGSTCNAVKPLHIDTDCRNV